MIYVFDGSLEGLLTAVFEYHERKPPNLILTTTDSYQPDAFTVAYRIDNIPAKADRVWKALQRKLPAEWLRKFYCAYLSERPEAFTDLFEFCRYIFSRPAGAEQNYGNPYVLAIAAYARKVEREKHRMEAFIRFQQSSDGFFYCGIDPDFNVIPLLMKHFEDRYADQKWMIYDLNRHYGIYYDLYTVEEICLNQQEEKNLKQQREGLTSEQEPLYATLWKDYFKSTNIKARKNTKLHVQHVPKRYWKYLTEKQ